MSAALAGALVAMATAASACEAAEVTSAVDVLPEAWARALEALIEATRREGRPWSCPHARIALTLERPPGPAQLVVVTSDGIRLERRIDRPEDLVPTGEALLARPLPPRVERTPSLSSSSPPPSSAPSSAAPPPASSPEPAAASPGTARAGRSASARLCIGMLGGAAFSGPSAAAWAGGMLVGVVPLDAWSIGIWARFDAAFVESQPVPSGFTMTSGSVGLSLGRLVVRAPVEIGVALEPSLTIVAMDDGPDDDTTPESARADARLGARIHVALPSASWWRPLASLSGELSPVALLGRARRAFPPDFPTLPAYRIGAAVGVEIMIR